MTDVRQQVADVLFSATVMSVGLLAGNSIVATIVGGIGVSLASDLVQRGWQATNERLFRGEGRDNHDLQKAMARSFERALERLEEQWWRTPRGSQMKRTDREGAEQTREAFRLLREHAESFCTPDGIGRAAGNATVSELLYGDDAQAKGVVFDCLRQYLYGHDAQLIEYLNAHLVDEIAFCFGEELKADRPDSNRAWRAFQRMLSESILASVKAGDAQIMAAIAALQSELITSINAVAAPARPAPGPRRGQIYGAIPVPPAGAIARREMDSLRVAIELDGSVAEVSGRSGVRVIHASGGQGKTVLVAQFANECASRELFPGGIYWLELGKNPSIPELQYQIGSVYGDNREDYVDSEAGKRMLQLHLQDAEALIVLDDCWEHRHAEPFLVAAPRCRWLVTTRKRSQGNRLKVPRGNVIALDCLMPEEGAALIAGRLELDPDADCADRALHLEIADLLGGHAQAIAIAAARLDPDGSHYLNAADLLQRLRVAQGGEKPFADLALDAEDRSDNLELSLQLSYDDIPDDLKRRYRALGVLAPGATFDRSLAQALWNDESVIDVQDALSALGGLSLLDRSDGERYSQHSLLRAYAMALQKRQGEHDLAFNRYAGWTLAFSGAFHALPLEEWDTFDLDLPHVDYIGDVLVARWRATPGDEGIARQIVEFATHVDRYVIERPVAVGTPGAVILRGMAWLETGLSAARRIPDPQAERTFLGAIGRAWSALGEQEKALGYLEQALPLSRAVGSRGGEAKTLNNIGGAWSRLGAKEKALGYYEQALALSRAVGSRGDEATTLNNIGLAWDALGAKEKALGYYEQAVSLHRAVGDRGGEATTLNNIGGAWSALGQQEKALGYLEQALPLRRAVGDRRGEAVTCCNIAMVHRALGDLTKAVAYLERCVDLDKQVHHPDLESDTRTLEIVRRERDGTVSPGRRLSDEQLAVILSTTRTVLGTAAGGSGNWSGILAELLAQAEELHDDDTAVFVKAVLSLLEEGPLAADAIRPDVTPAYRAHWDALVSSLGKDKDAPPSGTGDGQ